MPKEDYDGTLTAHRTDDDEEPEGSSYMSGFVDWLGDHKIEVLLAGTFVLGLGASYLVMGENAQDLDVPYLFIYENLDPSNTGQLGDMGVEEILDQDINGQSSANSLYDQLKRESTNMAFEAYDTVARSQI